MKNSGNKYVVIGGFSDHKNKLNRFCNELKKLTNSEVTGFTFHEAIVNQELLSKSLDGSVVITHSGGILALENLHEKYKKIIVNAPPTNLNFSTFIKRYLKRELLRIHKKDGALRGKYHISLAQLKTGPKIKNYALKNSIDHDAVVLVISHNDELFPYRDYATLPFDEIKILEGNHDYIFSNPAEYLKEIEDVLS